jgi:hypothetical protein
MNGAYMICWAMFGSGAGIYMMKKFTGLTGFSEEGDGMILREGAWLLIVGEVTRHFESMIWDFVWQNQSDNRI